MIPRGTSIQVARLLTAALVILAAGSAESIGSGVRAGAVLHRDRSSEEAGAVRVRADDFWERMDYLARLLCIILECYFWGEAAQGMSPAEVETRIRLQIGSFLNAGLREGLASNDIATGFSAINQIIVELDENPGRLSEDLEPEFRAALAAMRQDLVDLGAARRSGL